MTVARDMQTDFRVSLLADIGENIVYTPNGGSPRTIKATVRRLTSEVHAITRTLIARITVLNDGTYGISSDELDLGADTITLALREGKTPAVCRNLRLLSHSEATMTFEVH